MKKAIILICGIFTSVFLSGCMGLISGYGQSGGYPRPIPGLLYSEISAGGAIAEKMQSMKDVEVLGKVESQVSGTNVLMLVGDGDLSIKKAKDIALAKYPEADDIVNVEIDMKHRSVLGLFNTIIMYYRGIAIKYKK